MTIRKAVIPAAGLGTDDALHAMCAPDELLALTLGGKRCDIGDKIGDMKAIIEVGQQREELREVLMPYLRELAGEPNAITG